MASKTNTRHAGSTTTTQATSSLQDVCVCGHDGTHHGTSGAGACRFGTDHGCTKFTYRDA